MNARAHGTTPTRSSRSGHSIESAAPISLETDRGRAGTRWEEWVLGKLRPLSGRTVCRILEDHGFVQVRRRGSHVIVQKTDAKSTVSVPVPDHPELRIGTLAAIIRQSGVPRSAFE